MYFQIRILIALCILISACAGHSVYEVSNAYCSQTPTIYPFEGGHQLDGSYTLIRYSAIDYTDWKEAAPKCGNLTIAPTPSQLDPLNNKTMLTTRTNPFTNTLYTKSMNAIQTNAVITPGRWVTNSGLFQIIDGPLGKTRSLMFLKISKDRHNKVESFLYANCGMHPNGGIGSPGVGEPSMSEWGILVRAGLEHNYQDESFLSYLYAEALLQAHLPPLSAMTVVNYGNGQCEETI